jgi:hypothetical protein
MESRYYLSIKENNGIGRNTVRHNSIKMTLWYLPTPFRSAIIHCHFLS